MSNQSLSTCLTIDSDNDNDNWYGVQNARKRKQIQDRLAQRARRKRLSELKSKSDLTSATAKISDASLPAARGQAVNNDGALAVVCQSIESPASAWPPNSDCALSPSPMPVTPVSDHHLFSSPLQPTMSVYAALFKNGALLGLQCGYPVPLISSPVNPSTIPSSLHPTQLQMSILHSQFIDRFPFPRLRDNMICLSAYIDEEDFLDDLFNLTSFTLTPGCAPWDPGAWKMGREFGLKWGYLFF